MSIKNAEGLTSRLKALFARYGYTQYRMRKFEEYDLYLQNKSFLTSDFIITFTEPSGKLMALRPDVTLSIVKNHKDEGGLKKLFYKENVYRVDREAGAFREITQIGVECLGDADAYCKSEMLLLAKRSLEEISTDYVLDVSHLGILSSVLDSLGLGVKAKAEVVKCIGEKNTHGVSLICSREGVDAEKTSMLLTLMTSEGDAKSVIPALKRLPLPEEGKRALTELAAITEALEGEAEIRIDFSVVNDMNYYSGIVFRGFVYGVPSGVLSGGEYNYLMEKMGKKGGAIGFAVYPDLLESLYPVSEKYDADILLLYGNDAELKKIHAAVKMLSEGGKRAYAAREIPEKMRYGQLCRLTESGVEIIG